MIFTNESVRRRDRLLTEERARKILREGEYGVMSMQSFDGQGAYGLPLSYVWDGGSRIYIHCAPEGEKLRAIDRCSEVSFCVVGRTRVVPERFTTGYESIVARCRASHGLSDEERRAGLRLLVGKYCPDVGEAGEQNIERSFHRTELIRLDIITMSGKSKSVFG